MERSKGWVGVTVLKEVQADSDVCVSKLVGHDKIDLTTAGFSACVVLLAGQQEDMM